MQEKKLGLPSIVATGVGLIIATSCLLSIGQGASAIGLPFIITMAIACAFNILTAFSICELNALMPNLTGGMAQYTLACFGPFVSIVITVGGYLTCQTIMGSSEAAMFGNTLNSVFTGVPIPGAVYSIVLILILLGLNLFGVDYDSRLLAGTDVLSSGVHAAILSNRSFLTKAFRYDADTETVIPANEGIVISDELLQAYRQYVDNKFKLSSNIVNSDYYAHVFNKEPSGGSLTDTVVFTDIKSIFNQASVLYMYRNGYVDPESPNVFGGQSAAKLGEFVDVLYRIAGRPETDNSALPSDYESRSFNASYPYYDAVCWAYQTRLLRPNDPLNFGYNDKLDYRAACILIYRFAGMSGVNTYVDPDQLRQVMTDGPGLTREAAKAMIWCDQKDITSRDSSFDELLSSYDTRINRYQMTSFLFYLCTYELNLGN